MMKAVSEDTVWVVGRHLVSTSWELFGVFETRDEALAAAKSGEFFGPVPFGVRLPEDRIEWPEIEYKP